MLSRTQSEKHFSWTTFHYMHAHPQIQHRLRMFVGVCVFLVSSYLACLVGVVGIEKTACLSRLHVRRKLSSAFCMPRTRAPCSVLVGERLTCSYKNRLLCRCASQNGASRREGHHSAQRRLRRVQVLRAVQSRGAPGENHQHNWKRPCIMLDRLFGRSAA